MGWDGFLRDPWALVIDWGQKTHLPPVVGPFKTISEAEEWASLNVDPGRPWRVEQLAYPYWRAEDEA